MASELNSSASSDEMELSAIEVPAYEPCKCKSSCQTRRCPCKSENRKCSSHCKCGSPRKSCQNKVQIPGPTRAEVKARRRTEDEERRLENSQVKEFIATLDEEMVRKLAVKSLQKGVGSLDYINALLIAEDDEDQPDPYAYSNIVPRSTPSSLNRPPQQAESTSSSAASGPSPSTASSPTAAAPGAPHPRPPGPRPAWCKCGLCRVMPLEIENKCCGEDICVTTNGRFRKLCMDAEVLQLLIRDRADIRNDVQDSSARSFRKAAYRAYTLDRYGHLGKGNRKVAPSCVVWAIRDLYPAYTGVYMGFRSH